MAASDYHVIIAGAGVTGVLIAQGLKKAGIRASIYERYPKAKYEDRAGNWTVALHWSIPFIEACLPAEVFAKIKTCETNPWEEIDPVVAGNIPLINGRTGKVLAKMPMDHPKRASRGKLRDLFKEGLDIQYDMKLTDVRVNDDGNGVIARFNEGSVVVEGDVIIGADGAKSAVRDCLLDKEDGRLDVANALILSAFPTFTAEQALFIRNNTHPIMQLSPHPYQNTIIFESLADVVDRNKPESWVFYISLSIYTNETPPDEAERRHLFKSYMSTYCEPYRSIAKWITDDVHINGDKFHYWGKITPWKNFSGRITLAGDAAHPMVPFRAQGINNAIEDAKLYVDAIKSVVLDSKDLQTVIDDYDKSSYTRGKSDIQLSIEQMHAYHHWDEVMDSPLMKNGYGHAH
ncbi:hypothetical protein BGW36DRAFT_409362 [Talaromyces proteolyticus]|uniref:FAD-binding domain-containing protein n=1 Tax=Talaromyces proteolyticus TaxID=1131652 RepID=A0AAD4KJ55_9EURO|nr:uncharacterized protein BGW36DRAFT_409362 [Talaromyces proteolyticus]KAH8693720.1 hypothetical protein BGW36DRAFT_409362 [Talaromyces proteolyticus]